MKTRKKALRKFRKRSIALPVILFFVGVLGISFLAIYCLLTNIELNRKMSFEFSRKIAIEQAQNLVDSAVYFDNDIRKAVENSDLEVVVLSGRKQVLSNSDANFMSAEENWHYFKNYNLYITQSDYDAMSETLGSGVLVIENEGDLRFSDLDLFVVALESASQDDYLELFCAWFPTGVSCEEGELLVHAPILFPVSSLMGIVIVFTMFLLLIWIVAIVLIVNIALSAVRNTRLQNALYFDDKTLSRNWLFLTTKADEMLKRSSGMFGILSVKCSNYDHIKSCVGSAAADQLIFDTYYLLKPLLGKNDLIARYGDDSIGIVARRGDINAVANVVNAIVSKMNNEVYVGCYILDKPKKLAVKTESVEDYYYFAELACSSLDESSAYRASYFDEATKEKFFWLNKVETELDSALANEEFLVYIQPKYDPKKSEMRAGEALIRWNNADQGLVSPGKFIPICEENGSIVKIDDYMISHVAKLQSEWIRSGFKVVPISVNVSRAHFMQPQLAEHICALVDQWGTPHNLIEIELTESAFFDDKKVLLSTVTKLQQMGFLVSMDDFGSGYSSLNSLKDLSLDVLKLDAGFFSGEETQARGELIVAKAIELAKSLNLETVAEGVERKEQVDFLANAGCDLIQGYYFDKPLPKEEFESRMCKDPNYVQPAPVAEVVPTDANSNSN
ncbi:MAG: bifunctional diguanylate cyclase/phosphodiesterase [Saccharofermentans sp.]|nr:bifunctional diguanylate cyclase/phosphodiesterase [Saccharofermentans sp.]